MYLSNPLIDAFAALATAETPDLIQFIQPSVSGSWLLVDFSQLFWIGEAGGGNTIPGACLPLSMVRLGPDYFTGVDS